MTTKPNDGWCRADAALAVVEADQGAVQTEPKVASLSYSRRIMGADAQVKSLVAEGQRKEGEKEMSMSGATALRALLSDGGRELVNFKFLAGTGRDLSEDDMCGEAARVIRSALEEGMPHMPPVSGRDKVRL